MRIDEASADFSGLLLFIVEVPWEWRPSAWRNAKSPRVLHHDRYKLTNGHGSQGVAVTARWTVREIGKFGAVALQYASHIRVGNFLKLLTFHLTQTVTAGRFKLVDE